MNRKKLIIKIIRLLFLILCIIGIIKLFFWYKDNKQNEEIINNIRNKFIIKNVCPLNLQNYIINKEESEEEFTIDFENLKNINSDVVAWLSVPGTNIDYPVVKTTDNDYYLKHNIEKKYNDGGWIFADFKNNFDGNDKNIIIYGHSRLDGSMFGTLKNVVHSNWYEDENNKKILLITENEKIEYEVFSVYTILAEDYYIQTDFTNSNFCDFIYTLKNRSIKNFNVDVNCDDQILTLSTCYVDDKRVVLHAKKIQNS